MTWILKLILWCNSPIREHNPLITWPDDPLDLTSWFTDLDQSNWHMVVTPESFLDAMDSGVVWGIITSRWGTWHDIAHTMLEDAELSVVCDRFLDGDDPPWEGANLRHGTLVIDIVDKSGVMIGTSNGGTVWDGLVRTAIEFASDFIDSTTTLVADAETPTDYFLPGNRFTDKVKPYVVYRDGETSTIETSEWINSPAKGIQVNVGGHSMPGVNEIISASIQAAGDMVGSIFQIGSLGGTVDTLLKPLYEDTILAWWSVKSFQRAQHSGWERLFEYFQTAGGAGSKAYTLASLMVLRAGFWATRTVISWKVAVASGVPWLIGDRALNDGGTGLVARRPPKGATIKGFGHFFLDDRVGLVLAGDTAINMDRCRKLDLTWSAEDNNIEWKIGIGDDRIFQDPATRAFGKIESLIAGLKDLGVWTLVGVGLSASAVLAANFSANDFARPTHALATGSNVSILRGELMPAKTVSFGDISVGSMTNLVDRVFTMSAPSQIGNTIVSLDPVDVTAFMPGGWKTGEGRQNESVDE